MSSAVKRRGGRYTKQGPLYLGRRSSNPSEVAVVVDEYETV